MLLLPVGRQTGGQAQEEGQRGPVLRGSLPVPFHARSAGDARGPLPPFSSGTMNDAVRPQDSPFVFEPQRHLEPLLLAQAGKARDKDAGVGWRNLPNEIPRAAGRIFTTCALEEPAREFVERGRG